MDGFSGTVTSIMVNVAPMMLDKSTDGPKPPDPRVGLDWPSWIESNAHAANATITMLALAYDKPYNIGHTKSPRVTARNNSHHISLVSLISPKKNLKITHSTPILSISAHTSSTTSSHQATHIAKTLPPYDSLMYRNNMFRFMKSLSHAMPIEIEGVKLYMHRYYGEWEAKSTFALHA